MSLALYLSRVRSSDLLGGDRQPRPRQALHTVFKLPVHVKQVALEFPRFC